MTQKMLVGRQGGGTDDNDRPHKSKMRNDKYIKTLSRNAPYLRLGTDNMHHGPLFYQIRFGFGRKLLLELLAPFAITEAVPEADYENLGKHKPRLRTQPDLTCDHQTFPKGPRYKQDPVPTTQFAFLKIAGHYSSFYKYKNIQAPSAPIARLRRVFFSPPSLPFSSFSLPSSFSSFFSFLGFEGVFGIFRDQGEELPMYGDVELIKANTQVKVNPRVTVTWSDVV